MWLKSTLLIAIVCIANLVFAQEKYSISGAVQDGQTGEYLLGALVVAKEVQKGVATNVYGFYSMTLEKGTYTIEVSSMGYADQVFELVLDADQSLNVNLTSQSVEMKMIVIEADKSRNTESTEVGKIVLEMDQVKKLPVLFGEVDILKTITLLPGVQSSGEGNAGFYVRGGGVDQNLILLDNAAVYNASHLFGFFSVFNADAVKNLELTKGGVPANYGGRLSSVLDINLKEGNSKEWHGEGGIGLIASRFTIEGPLKKDTSSLIISGRRTYIDVITKPFLNPDGNFAGSGYYFYDLNAKLNYKITQRDQLFLSGYFGRDVFGFKSSNADFETKIPWGNATGTLRWNRIISDKIFMNTILTFTDYKFEFQAIQDQFEFRLKSGIRDYGGKVQFNYYPNFNHNLKWGGEYVNHQFTPNNVFAKSGDVEFDLGEQVKIRSHEFAAYILDEWDVSETLRINAGLRMSHFIHVGPFDRYIPNEDNGIVAPGEPEVIEYGRGEKVADYTGFEPRINFRYKLDKKSAIKGGFMRNYQYIHLTSLSPTSLPTDVWIPSTDLTKPQIGMQYSIGYFRNFENDTYETSVEFYYKDMFNQTEYKEGAQPEQTVNDNIDNLLVYGKGYSYGAEFFVKKRLGNLNGWVGYTWSKTSRIFEGVNNGEEFPTRWDRRHDLSVVGNYRLNSRWEFGFVFVYGTGNAITLPLERYFVEGQIVDRYGPRNSFRMAPYHRADISATLHGKPNKKRIDKVSGEKVDVPKKIQSSLNFSIYNLYNRQNPYFIYFGTDGRLDAGNLQIKAYQVSLFPILPSVTWNFKF